MGFDWSNSKTFQSGNSKDREKLSDVVDVVEYPDGDYGAYRFLANPKGTAVHWITTLGKPKAGQKAKLANFPKVCLGFNPETMEVESEKCPYCTLLELNPRVEIRQNVIDRALQEGEPRKVKPPSKTEAKLRTWNGGKWHIKDGKNKGGWTPVRVMSVIPAIGNGIAEITSLNKHKINGERVTFGPDHKKYGYDVMVKYDKNAAPAKMYQTQKGEINPITEEEMGLLLWDIPDHKPEDEKAALKEAKRMKPFLCNREGELMFPDAADEEGVKKGKKRNQIKDNFDEDDDAEDDDDDDDDRPTKKGKAKSKVKSKSWEDDDDDDGEPPFDVDDDDDEDERPSKKSKLKGKTSKTKVKVKPSTTKVKVKLKPKSSSRRNAKKVVVKPVVTKKKIKFKRSFAA